MKKIVLLLLLLSSVISAQQLDMNLLKGIKPRAIGPAGMSGRITAVEAVNTNPDIIYAGAASGGVWKSESGGINWKPIFEKEATASIGAIAIQQSNPDVVWVGTGEGNPRNSLNGGFGIYKTLDAGKTWQMMGLQKTRNIQRIVIDPNNPNTVYVGAIGSPWGAHPERGVYKTTDGGKTWQIVANNTLPGYISCVQYIPNSKGKKLMAVSTEGIYYSKNAGKKWDKLSDKGFYTIRFADKNTAFLGGRGTISILELTYKND